MTLQLSATVRTLPTPELNQARLQGKVPIELYGHNQTNQHLFVDLIPLEKAFAQAGESSLIDLVISDGGKSNTVKAVIVALQYASLSGKIKHVDFNQVKMDEIMQAKVSLVFVGESKAVKELGGTLIKSSEEVEIACLPTDLIHQISVDISVLENLNQMIKVADLIVPANVKIVSPAEQVVIAVKPALKEKAVETAPVAAEAAAAGTAPVAEAEAKPKAEKGKTEKNSAKG